jgi:hypothetical protein
VPAFDARRQTRFLELIAAGISVSGASKELNVGRSTIYDKLERDERFKERFDAAREEGVQALEDEARRRAVEGVEEPVFYQGEIVGHVRRYSDGMLMFLLKALRPQTYREHLHHRHRSDEPIEIRLAFDPDK